MTEQYKPRTEGRTQLGGLLLACCLFVLCAAARTARGINASGPGAPTPWDYFRPAWEIVDSHAELAAMLSDPKGRLEPDFKIPLSLKRRVHFWTLIYGLYDSKFRVVHDRHDPSLIYGVIDFSRLYSLNIPPFMRQRAVQAISDQVVAELRRRLIAAWHQTPLAVVSPRERDEWRRLVMSAGVKNESGFFRLAKSIRTQTGQREMFEAALTRSSALLPEMEMIFRRQHLPVGLTRMPFVESSFNTRARSKVLAVGIWQFMPRTARAFIDPSNKKRWNDPLVQTEAAARWLRRFRRALPDWGSTITAYNSGTSRIGHLMRKHRLQNIEQLVQFAASEEKLGFAGQNFFAEVLAANLVETYKTSVFVPALFSRPGTKREVASYRPRRRIPATVAAGIAPAYRTLETR